ncbi:MAG: bifunctional 3-deoxy-7-phosphoheptulonate synthase/chorismate mutase type II [Bacteroidales bacterium]|nr:bifunctional 3-deoxy-7-phosphoheptulonate synthase/chorismate mutase type II [Bacteroidales bacterium]
MFTDLQTIPGTADNGSLLIAGPCSAESRDQVMATARRLAAAGVRVFRAGVWKPRTRPGGFEGVGLPALQWLADVKAETGMITATEVATRDHLEAAVDAGVDIVWIGARTSANPFAVQEIADAIASTSEQPAVLVKNPVSPDLELWIGALQRIYDAGVRRLGAIHRGFSTYGESKYRNPPHWSIPIELRRRLAGLPVICDPSHITGHADMVASVARQAIDMGFDGLIIESHIEPCRALSDSAQQITPDQLKALMADLAPRRGCVDSPTLDDLRRRIDEIDDELLEVVARRMSIAREIGAYKRLNGMAVIQPDRYNTLMSRRITAGTDIGLSENFMRQLLAALHEESVRHQIEDGKNDREITE